MKPSKKIMSTQQLSNSVLSDNSFDFAINKIIEMLAHVTYLKHPEIIRADLQTAIAVVNGLWKSHV